ncbi:hypothetical protein CcrJ4_gp453 [Caulobacter phage J4]|nr:hypothetical protein CcrJ4_gp453 [Caulobacter phage J4]
MTLPVDTKAKLLSRDQFREAVFARDGHACVFCKRRAEDTPEGKLDAHHILERRLFQAPHEKGGYFLGNGATVCEDHHRQCESTQISVDEVYAACGITRRVLPDHLYSDLDYDKWGNIVTPSGERLKGELYGDESVQKIMAQCAPPPVFKPYVKYPRTNHLPWSPGLNDDDRVLKDLSAFIGERVIVTTKMDGEQTNMYRDHYHARSVESAHHESQGWAKNFWSQICGDIPEGWRVCGENLYAKHSIAYDALPTYFMGFGVWNDLNQCLSWDDTLEWFELLGVTPVPVIYDGVFDEAAIKALYDAKTWDTCEGYVLRVARSFSYGEFRACVGKFVRAGHVQTTKHWKHGQRVEKNGLVSA